MSRNLMPPAENGPAEAAPAPPGRESTWREIVRISAQEPARSALRPLRRLLSQRVFNALPVRINRGRLRLYLNPNDTDTVLAYALDVFERQELQIVSRIVRPGDAVLDIGANIGYYSVKLSALCGSKGTVHVFEPDPTNFGILSRNVALNRLQNVTAYNLALADFDGEGTLYRSLTNAGDYSLAPHPQLTARPVRVACRRLDSLAGVSAHTPSLIKIDVQGFEEAVLRGGGVCFEGWSPRPAMLIEFEPEDIVLAGHTPAGLIDLLTGMGYQVAPILGGRLSPLSPDQAKRYQGWLRDSCNLLALHEGSPQLRRAFFGTS
jgi:FkbM family methyltransferase